MLAMRAFFYFMARSIIDFLFEKKKRRQRRKVWPYGDIGNRIMRDDPSTYPDYPKRKKNR
jgi:hypothetical protein